MRLLAMQKQSLGVTPILKERVEVEWCNLEYTLIRKNGFGLILIANNLFLRLSCVAKGQLISKGLFAVFA